MMIAKRPEIQALERTNGGLTQLNSSANTFESEDRYSAFLRPVLFSSTSMFPLVVDIIKSVRLSASETFDLTKTSLITTAIIFSRRVRSLFFALNSAIDWFFKTEEQNVSGEKSNFSGCRADFPWTTDSKFIFVP